MGIVVTPTCYFDYVHTWATSYITHEKYYFLILLLSSTEHAIRCFSAILYIVLSQGTDHEKHFFFTKRLPIFFYGTHLLSKSIENWHALLNTKHFSGAITCSVRQTSHNWEHAALCWHAFRYRAPTFLWSERRLKIYSVISMLRLRGAIPFASPCTFTKWCLIKYKNDFILFRLIKSIGGFF